MLKSKDISNYSKLPKDKKRILEKQMQQDDLSYLSSIAFEKFSVNDSDIDSINKLIDKQFSQKQHSFNTILVSVLSGLLIGISVFFVIFQKSKNHPSHYQSIDEEKILVKNDPTILIKTDSTMPMVEKKPMEHFNTIANHIEELKDIEQLENMDIKSIDADLPISEDKKELIYMFVPNAPVIFIHNLKVSNYRLYYFKQNEAIDISNLNGLRAQYGSASDIETLNGNTTNIYFAHKIISKAMKLLNSNSLTNCVEELTLLYNYNHDDANAQFYLGLCYFQQNKFDIAKSYFQMNLNNVNNVFHQESEYYQALCLLHTNQIEEAKKQLQFIFNNQGFYSERAKEVLQTQMK